MKWSVPVAQPELNGADFKALAAAYRSGRITQGPQTELFEKEFAAWCGARHGVAASNGTAAVHLALMGLDVKPGDEVICSSISCIATANPVTFQGARLKFVDIDPATCNLDPALLERAVTPRTKGILLVHLFGRPADMDAVMRVARRHKLWVIEDCCLAHGAVYKGSKVGTIGDAGCFSFYANKILTTGEGGMVVTNNPRLAARMRAARVFGQEPGGKPFFHPIMGSNYKMTDLQSAVGRSQLKRAEEFIRVRRENVANLSERLADVDGIERLPSEDPYTRHVYFSYYITLKTRALKERLERALHRAGIDTRPFFSVIPDQPCYRRLGYSAKSLPKSMDVHRRSLYVSNSPALTARQKALMASTIRKALGAAA